MLRSPKIIIIGAGPTGLGAGWRLSEGQHTNFLMYEKNSYIGGLASSFLDERGFTWDIGGHVIHSHYPYFDQVFKRVMKGEFFTHQRESWIYMDNRFIPFPFQNNIHRLRQDQMNECLLGLYKAKKEARRPRHFGEWLKFTYGAGIAKYFLTPYNRKVWAYSLDNMGFSWVGDRVSPVDISRIEHHIRTNKDDISWGPNAVFHYPKKGGTGELWRRIGQKMRSHIVLNKAVIRIDAKKKKVHFSDGSSDFYDVLLTTMPLDVLVQQTTELSLPSRAGALHASAVTIVGLGIQGETPAELRTKCWIYIPQQDVPFFRATVLSNYSRLNAPKGAWSLMTEISSSESRPLPSGNIISSVVDSVKKLGFIGNHPNIFHTWSMSSRYGYPTPTLDRDYIVGPYLAALEAYNIFSRGRFGTWRYEISNQDHAFMQGVEWVDRVLHNKPETVLTT